MQKLITFSEKLIKIIPFYFIIFLLVILLQFPGSEIIIPIILTLSLVSLILNWLINSINLIIEGKKENKNKIILGIFSLISVAIFPLSLILAFSPIPLLIKSILGIYLLICPIVFIIFIVIFSSLANKIEKTKRISIFGISYFFILALPIFLMLITASSSPSPAIDAKIKASTSQMRASAELFKIRNNRINYKGIEFDNDISMLIKAVNKITKRNDNILISPDNSKWCFKVELINQAETKKNFWEKSKPMSWCVDSNGYAGKPTDNNENCNSQTQSYSCD